MSAICQPRGMKDGSCNHGINIPFHAQKINMGTYFGLIHHGHCILAGVHHSGYNWGPPSPARYREGTWYQGWLHMKTGLPILIWSRNMSERSMALMGHHELTSCESARCLRGPPHHAHRGHSALMSRWSSTAQLFAPPTGWTCCIGKIMSNP